MTRDIHTLRLNDNLYDAQIKFDKYKVRHLPVLDANKLVGIISLTDILRMSFGERFGDSLYQKDEVIFEMLTIDQVMKHKPKTVTPENTVADAAEILAHEEFHALPVVKGDNLVGIVTTTDVIRFLLEN